MSTGAESDEIKLYLLGELTEAQLIRLEERYFADSDFFDQIDAAEDDLIEKFLLGTLSRHEQSRLKELFLVSPSARQKLTVITAIHGYVREDEEKPKLYANGIRKFSLLRVVKFMTRPWRRAREIVFFAE